MTNLQKENQSIRVFDTEKLKCLLYMLFYATSCVK